MSHHRIPLLIVLAVATAHADPRAASREPPPALPAVGADVALSSLAAISDGYLRKLSDSLALVARSDAAQAGDWRRLRPLLQDVGQRNVDAALWFVRPDGTYWTVAHGRESARLSERPYFAKLMAGHPVLGDLVVSKSTGKSVGIVAVPVRRGDGTIAGALGASVYLDQLSARVSRDMGLHAGQIFYSFDARPLLGLAWDPTLIFVDPRTLSPDIRRAFDDMLARRAGVERYAFRGNRRTVVFRRSDVTGWWYAFGVVEHRPGR